MRIYILAESLLDDVGEGKTVLPSSVGICRCDAPGAGFTGRESELCCFGKALFVVGEIGKLVTESC
jgi:hypothetical protein